MSFVDKLADMCMPFLYFLESIRNPVCDFFFETITHLGEETVFLVIAIFIFWCIDKREGYFVLFSGFFGTIINQAAKLTFRVDRPWVKDPGFTVVGDAKIEATGYSFPSGHTQNIATTFGAVAAYNHKRRLVNISSIVIIALVAFSRMYLGVHTPLDVIVSLLIALGLTLLLRPFFISEERFDKSFPWIVVSAAVAAVLLFVYVMCLGTDETLDPVNYASGLKNSCTMLGCMVGMLAVFYVDKYAVKFDTGAPWYSQILKLVLGLCGVLIIKSGLSAPLTALFGNEYVARAVRYFLVVVFAGATWPMTFKYFANLRIASLDAFGEKVAAFFTRKKSSPKE
ncbi:MAG: phosphatase PAP2 family protein [Clostridia bacterium]|nr:phosphatase PAP2 family protein [Clostridia bacterium]